MKQIEKNTVSAQNQMKSNQYVYFGEIQGTGPRILFVGNSITMHGSRPGVDWYCEGDGYGMAASSKENDYVHLVMEKIREKYPGASFCIAQAAIWESHYPSGREYLPQFENARAYEPVIIIFRIVENCSWDPYDKVAFFEEYNALIDYLNPSNNACVILTTSFWVHPADHEILEIGRLRDYPTIYLGDLGEDDSMKALGLFSHEGVANHPGDKGMRMIADRIVDAIYKNVNL